MKIDKPILFSGPMVLALLREAAEPGTGKTNTRRVLKPQPEGDVQLLEHDDQRLYVHPRPIDSHADEVGIRIPYAVHDLLWVREAHYLTDDGDEEYAVYVADGNEAVGEHLHEIASLERRYPNVDWSRQKKQRPSIHLPRWASRLTLRVTDVRVQRVQEISEADAKAEGTILDGNAYWTGLPPESDDPVHHYVCHRLAFQDLWDSLNAPRGFGWAENPWVAAYTFQVIAENVDAVMEREAA